MYVFFKSVIKSFPSKIENCSLVFVSLPHSPGLLCRLLSRRFLCLVPCRFGVCFFYLTYILGTAVSSHVLDNPHILCFLKSLYKASFSLKAFRFFSAILPQHTYFHIFLIFSGDSISSTKTGTKAWQYKLGCVNQGLNLLEQWFLFFFHDAADIQVCEVLVF